jgi:hypothetical protein
MEKKNPFYLPWLRQPARLPRAGSPVPPGSRRIAEGHQKMTLSENILNYLVNHPRQRVCHGCLSQSLGRTPKLVKEALQTLRTMFHASIHRGTGQCSVCGNEEDVTAWAQI